jgi:hypothetical protein
VGPVKYRDFLRLLSQLIIARRKLHGNQLPLISISVFYAHKGAQFGEIAFVGLGRAELSWFCTVLWNLDFLTFWKGKKKSTEAAFWILDLSGIQIGPFFPEMLDVDDGGDDDNVGDGDGDNDSVKWNMLSKFIF